jgi:hypothetical protein
LNGEVKRADCSEQRGRIDLIEGALEQLSHFARWGVISEIDRRANADPDFDETRFQSPQRNDMTIQHTLLAAVLTTLGFAGAASAQAPYSYGMPYGHGMAGPEGMPPSMTGGGMPGYETPEMAAEKRKFGWHPGLKELFSSKPCQGDDCAKHGLLHGYFSKSPPKGPPPAVGGTLVFPNHPFVRSPRDWFEQ